ncbi:hypothetical protein TELCIR_14467, partial [Teladorsagia circumcincta]
YGTDAPDSPVGRIFCLVYLFFGIPLYLITLADLAKFCTEFMNKLYIDIIKCKYRMRRKYRRWKSGRIRRDSIKVGQVIIAGGEDEDPLSWLKEVQQRRIEAMKREAMRKLFETVTALHHIRFTALKHLAQKAPEMLPDCPESPRNLIASHATADSVLLRWSPPVYVDEGKRYWYTLTYKPRYILCVSAEHNYGLAAMSKSIRFRTKRWWADDDSTCLQLPNANRRLSMASVISSLSALR